MKDNHTTITAVLDSIEQSYDFYPFRRARNQNDVGSSAEKAVAIKEHLDRFIDAGCDYSELMQLLENNRISAEWIHEQARKIKENSGPYERLINHPLYEIVGWLDQCITPQEDYNVAYKALIAKDYSAADASKIITPFLTSRGIRDIMTHLEDEADMLPYLEVSASNIALAANSGNVEEKHRVIMGISDNGYNRFQINHIIRCKGWEGAHHLLGYYDNGGVATPHDMMTGTYMKGHDRHDDLDYLTGLLLSDLKAKGIRAPSFEVLQKAITAPPFHTTPFTVSWMPPTVTLASVSATSEEPSYRTKTRNILRMLGDYSEDLINQHMDNLTIDAAKAVSVVDKVVTLKIEKEHGFHDPYPGLVGHYGGEDEFLGYERLAKYAGTLLNAGCDYKDIKYDILRYPITGQAVKLANAIQAGSSRNPGREIRNHILSQWAYSALPTTTKRWKEVNDPERGLKYSEVYDALSKAGHPPALIEQMLTPFMYKKGMAQVLLYQDEVKELVGLGISASNIANAANDEILVGKAALVRPLIATYGYNKNQINIIVREKSWGILKKITLLHAQDENNTLPLAVMKHVLKAPLPHSVSALASALGTTLNSKKNQGAADYLERTRTILKMLHHSEDEIDSLTGKAASAYDAVLIAETALYAHIEKKYGFIDKPATPSTQSLSHTQAMRRLMKYQAMAMHLDSFMEAGCNYSSFNKLLNEKGVSWVNKQAKLMAAQPFTTCSAIEDHPLYPIALELNRASVDERRFNDPDRQNRYEDMYEFLEAPHDWNVGFKPKEINRILTPFLFTDGIRTAELQHAAIRKLIDLGINQENIAKAVNNSINLKQEDLIKKLNIHGFNKHQINVMISLTDGWSKLETFAKSFYDIGSRPWKLDVQNTLKTDNIMVVHLAAVVPHLTNSPVVHNKLIEDIATTPPLEPPITVTEASPKRPREDTPTPEPLKRQRNNDPALYNKDLHHNVNEFLAEHGYQAGINLLKTAANDLDENKAVNNRRFTDIAAGYVHHQLKNAGITIEPILLMELGNGENSGLNRLEALLNHGRELIKTHGFDQEQLLAMLKMQHGAAILKDLAEYAEKAIATLGKDGIIATIKTNGDALFLKDIAQAGGSRTRKRHVTDRNQSPPADIWQMARIKRVKASRLTHDTMLSASDIQKIRIGLWEERREQQPLSSINLMFPHPTQDRNDIVVDRIENHIDDDQHYNAAIPVAQFLQDPQKRHSLNLFLVYHYKHWSVTATLGTHCWHIDSAAMITHKEAVPYHETLVGLIFHPLQMGQLQQPESSSNSCGIDALINADMFTRLYRSGQHPDDYSRILQRELNSTRMKALHEKAQLPFGAPGSLRRFLRIMVDLTAADHDNASLSPSPESHRRSPELIVIKDEFTNWQKHVTTAASHHFR